MEESLAEKTGPWPPPAANRLQPARRDHGVCACVRGSRDQSGAQGLEHLWVSGAGGVCVCAAGAEPPLPTRPSLCPQLRLQSSLALTVSGMSGAVLFAEPAGHVAQRVASSSESQP